MMRLGRFLFFSLVVFELLNVLKILKLNTQFTWLGLLITALFSWGLVEYIYKKYEKTRGHHLHWVVIYITILALSLDAAGDFFHLYGRFDWWDQVVHFFVPAIVCFTLFTVINAFWIDKVKFVLLFKAGRLKLSLLLASTSAMSLSALYEIEEYSEDLIFHTNRLGPGTDTANDLFCDFLGVCFAVAIVFIYYLFTHKRKIID